VNFWNESETASIGIERIAEQGINTEFNQEVNTAITAGNANFYIDGDDLDTATGSIIINGLVVDENFSYLTLVSMIAPSPDWMIGINNVNLRENDEWLPLLTFDLYVYDTGTDDGMNYVSPNADSNPRGVITNMIGVFPFNSEKVGTLTITLRSAQLRLKKSAGTTELYIFIAFGQFGKPKMQSRLGHENFGQS
jgi:hypothetical protein